MVRPGADMGKADLLEELADRALVIDDTETFLDHPLQVDPAPADNAVDRAVGPGFDDGGEGRDLVDRKPRRMAFATDVHQPVGAVLVEAMNPVAQRLTVHAADPGGRIPAHPIQYGRQGEKAPALPGVTRGCGKASKGGSGEIAPQGDGGRHGANPPRAKGNTANAPWLPA